MEALWAAQEEGGGERVQPVLDTRERSFLISAMAVYDSRQVRL